MSEASMPAAHWYPDPEHPGQLRYWDGAAWTEHRAPTPTAQPQSQPAMTGVSAPSAPSGSRAWTASTVVTLLVCVVLVIGAAITAVAMRGHAAAAHERQAAETLDGFLQNSTTGHPDWREFANQKLLDTVTVGSPLLGEQSTAEALDLSVDYEVGPLTFHSYLRGYPADLASAEVRLTYSFTLRDEQVDSTAVQHIWLSRPFYYGDDVPARATDDEPTAIGPWRVTSLTAPRTATVVSVDRFFSTDFEVPGAEEIDGNICFDPAFLLEDVSTAARVEAEILSHCFVYDGSIALGEQVDMADLAASFPVISAQQ